MRYCRCCREWEASLLAKDASDEKQQGRVRSLFHRQLQVPLADGEETLAAYRAWETSLNPDAEVSRGPLARRALQDLHSRSGVPATTLSSPVVTQVPVQAWRQFN